ncbi:MAG TPA: glycosyltransferase family 2 protein [Acidobacteriaceae bacterium]|jgi:glycosyltransferase involved in cell wall biosynthesis|nr:glycosyltransferase family 2 protein [Acidobacteriaceae bacterium]
MTELLSNEARLTQPIKAIAANPLISIVTPSFNQAAFIQETLRSVELQHYRPLHQIVIDGGSTDGTVELLQRWEATDHGPDYAFEWISERDRGHADALNKGFDRVRGEIVGWLNSDDVYFDRDAVGSVVRALACHPEVDAVSGDVALISESSGLQMILCYPQFRYDRALRGYMLAQPAVFLRRAVTDKHRLDPSLRVSIDFIYWLQIGKQHRFLRIPRILAADRDQPARISRVSSAAMKETMTKVYADFEAPGPQSRTALFLDVLVLRWLRVTAFFRLLPWLKRRDDLAFPMWIDSVRKMLRRQLTMRANNRNSLGPRPSRTDAES